jgi:hypothetical protein
MSNFWPMGIEISDMQSPMQILETAQQEWEQSSNGLLTLLFQEATSESGNDIIIVHAKHVYSNRTVTLFSVIYRPNSPYPATIQPKNDDLPNFLKKSYYQPNIDSKVRLAGQTDMQMSMAERLMKSVEMSSGGQQVKNTWVSDAPSEFREKLKEVFNLSIVKSDILNLVSTSQEVANK